MKTVCSIQVFNRSAFLVRLLACVMLALTFVPLAEAGAKRKPAVLVVHAELNTSWVTDVQSKLNSSSQFGVVDSFNANSGTPTLAQLLPYDAVLLFSDGTFSNATAVGNNLADYVDAGGGVVNMAFSTTTFAPPAGRWNPGYLSMAAGGANISGASTLDLASITNQNHPILIGVGSFSGGSSSYRANQNNVVAGATIVARWTGGNVLVSTGPLPGRADLNFFPVSNAMRSDFWDASTGGVKLMVNSLLYVMRPRVLIAGAPATAAWNSDVQSKLMATGVLGMVDIFNTSTGTPTLTQLQKYDAVLVYSDSPAFFNPTALGNVMADYVDSGGGVVSAMFAYNGGALSMGGRWQTGNYDIFNQSGQTSGNATLGAAVYPAHPILSGVVSFNGGSSSYRMGTTTLKPGGLTVVNWSDGRALAAVSTKMANRADLNFFPPSSSTGRADFWQAGTDGGKIMANALLYTAKPYVLLAPADSQVTDVMSKLQASRRFSKVDSLNITAAAPALATLSPYNAVATWSNSSYANPTGVGNVLADYLDAGGGEVTTIFGNIGASFPQGRWFSQGYEITPSPLPNALISGPVLLGAVLEPNHPIASFVRTFDGGTNSFRQNATPLLRGRTIMRWADGKMLASVHNYKKRADLGYWPVSNTTSNGWNQRTDGTWITANALEFVVRSKPCPGDFNGDGFVDDTDFVLFADYYNNLIDPRGDLNGDGLTEDSDFVIFAGAYDALLCP